MSELSNQLRAYREAAGFTQEEASERSGLAVGSISDWERAVRVPNISKLNKLAQVYGATIDAILNHPPGVNGSAPKPKRDFLDLLTKAGDLLEDATRQDPEEAKRRSTMALGVLRMATEEARRET